LIIDHLLGTLTNIDDSTYRKALSVIESANKKKPWEQSELQIHRMSSKNSSVLDLDPRFIGQQLTAIDLENFMSIRPYTLLTGTKSDTKVQSMINNFNLLSRHVVVSILKAHTPHTVAAHWIEVALQLRKMKNFNSLKAVIAGLTNEAIYRLKQTVWDRLTRPSQSTFKWLSTIVDDVDNQTLLRHTQLVIEGTAKINLEDESFGTIPYLGTFLTDLTMIDSRYPTYIQQDDSKQNKQRKLINFEKCSKQYEILMQIHLLQKNVQAALHSINESQKMEMNHLSHEVFPSNLKVPWTPRVARIFRSWFNDAHVARTTDKECYALSLALEAGKK